jgi:catechol 2,3-dioxygenase-like lactoylglutathione lyase family enzyme
LRNTEARPRVAPEVIVVLNGVRVHTTIAASDLDRARQFYEEKLGLTPSEETPGGLFYDMEESRFLLYPSAGAGTAQHTVMGFVVDDIEREVAELKERGLVFEEYDFPGLKTVNSIADTGSVRAAWFKDSEGNILGVVQLQDGE